MVKYRSIEDNYRSFLIDGLKNSGLGKMPKANYKADASKIKEDQYIPSWRAACDAWVTKRVEDKPNVHTPVYLLYNAYINDNPDDYMDIGQFGKVLRSRFPYRKRRRGKQGQQVYVYQDVALKPKEEIEDDDFKCDGNQRQTSPSSSLQAVEVIPSVVFLNDTGGRLLSSPQLSQERQNTLSPISERNTSSPSKRKDSSELNGEPFSLNFKKQKKNYNSGDSDEGASQQKSGDDKYNSSLCRMAIGRRWIDINLLDMPGHHTYADAILRAYSEDHPNEPITFTSLSLLIRGKYPGKRKKITFGSKTKYIYQDLLLKKAIPKDSTINHSTPIKNEATIPLIKTSANSVTRNSSPISKTACIVLPVSSNSAINDLPSINTTSYLTSTSPLLIPTVIPSTTTTSPLLIPTVIPSTTTTSTLLMPTVIPSTTTTSPLLIPTVIPSTSYVSGQETKISNRRSPFNDPIYVYEAVPKENYKNYIPTTVMGVAAKPSVQMNKTVSCASSDSAGMNVSEYIANEFIDMNDLDKIGNCTLAIKDPITNAVPIPENSSSNRSSPTSYIEYPSNTDFFEANMVHDYSLSIPGYSNYTYEIQNPSNIPITVENLPYIEVQNSNKPWDYEIRKRLSPEHDYDLTTQTNTIPELSKVENYPVYTHKKMKNRVRKNETIPNINTSMNNLSLDNKEHSNFKNNSGSPTSSSPPGAAMSRLAQEIDTSSPQVGEPLNLTKTSTLYSETDSQRIVSDSVSQYEQQYKDILKSTMATAKEIFTNQEFLDNISIERRFEESVINKNPAVSYELSDASFSSCKVTSNLKDLELYSPEQAINLIRHHQTCPALGCSNECRTLRAAYFHISLFQHKCDVYKSFLRIIAKHSRRCRIISCGVEFCHFAKHELHLTGVSVLPIQLLKERPTVEEEFRECERLGSHDGLLSCHHRERSKLPVMMDPSKSAASNMIDKKDQDIRALIISSSYPDTPCGNNLAVHVTNTVELVRELFQKTHIR